MMPMRGLNRGITQARATPRRPNLAYLHIDMATYWTADAEITVSYDADTRINTVSDLDLSLTGQILARSNSPGALLNRTFRFGALFRAENGIVDAGRVDVTMKLKRGSGTYIDSTNIFALTADWAYQYVDLTGDNADQSNITMFFNKNTGGTPADVFECRDIRLEEIT